jgi:hypothetical protein
MPASRMLASERFLAVLPRNSERDSPNEEYGQQGLGHRDGYTSFVIGLYSQK